MLLHATVLGKHQVSFSDMLYLSHWIHPTFVTDFYVKHHNQQDSFPSQVKFEFRVESGKFVSLEVTSRIFLSISDFMYFWALVYLVSTTLVAIFKKDNSLTIVENEKELDMSIKQSYKLLLEILKLKPVQCMALLLLTCKVKYFCYIFQ